ncbi:hypothetical protein BCR34DRAFT_623719 [Clohesyomyces aquaticus]|uniref:DUF7702 domain-containing protein n=1 Tax=Clohesyomyces aquaticus TaxID=1231657 RepID=A0A1Y1ZTJ9_9PLEO|nr:hypothetical protein BCR34DRAFT_623719 [Clohesyomyces aquaticus]
MGNGDGQIHYRDGIALAQVILFATSTLVALKLRWTGRMCWFTIGGFSIIRTVGAGCMLGTINKDSMGLWAGVFVCEGLGILMLIFALWEMMGRINSTVPTVHKRIFQVPQILTYIDIGVSIAGFITVSKKKHDQLLPTPWSRAGIAILFLIYLYTVGVWAYFWFQRHRYDQDSTRLAMCVGACMPLMLIRVTYSLIFIATANMMWNAVKGSPTAYLLMTMIPEVIMVGLCCFTVWNTLPAIEMQKQAKYQRAEEEGQSLGELPR